MVPVLFPKTQVNGTATVRTLAIQRVPLSSSGERIVVGRLPTRYWLMDLLKSLPPNKIRMAFLADTQPLSG